ncbi:tetratricopeptide repeat protein [Micromonospora sp. NPDC002296]|uniref:tetratricopeptide repeat protein n=1 Tax=Micromonospora sp. NPDC002296 TaxID=3154271 RepID=UPI003317682D
MAELRVAALGPLRVERAGEPVPLGPRLSVLLSVLLIEAGNAVPADRLVDVLWDPPVSPGAAATLRSHLSNLRRALRSAGDPDGVVRTVGAGVRVGYRLDLPDEHVDVRRFERGYATGRSLLAAGGRDVEEAARLIGAALALWRGPAYADVADRPFARAETARLYSLRRAARRSHAEALLVLGRQEEALADLDAAVVEEPYDEGLRRLLALALYAERRVDEAAEVCRSGVALLRERGLEAPELEDLHLSVLRRSVPALPSGPAAAALASPALLPPDPPWFVGRRAELAEARRLLLRGAGPAPAPILVVTGPAAVGKTSFAIRLGHDLAAEFPDGQLHVDLRGFDPAGAAVAASEVLREFLDALGVAPQRLPDSLGARVGLYRGLLADRRMLVVLDNALDAEQVRPLLPGGAGCGVLVTSRRQLSGLLIADGAQPLLLDLLSVAESTELLARRLGSERLAAEPGAVGDIVDRCARLPLALAIVAARAVTRPGFSLEVLATELRESRGSLDAFDGGDAGADVRAVLSWSYDLLSESAARLFRQLGHAPGAGFGMAAAASLAGLPVREARPLLAELTNAHLVTEHRPGRFTFHDLLRAYSVELASALDSLDGRQAAVRRVVGHYLHSAYVACRRLDENREVAPSDLEEGVTPVEPADRQGALVWFGVEHSALVATVERAFDAGLDVATGELASALETYFDYRGHWCDWVGTQQVALCAAVRSADRPRQAQAHRRLGNAYTQAGRLDDARIHYRRASALYRELGDRVSEAHTHRGHGWVLIQQGRVRESLRHNRRALALYREVDHRAGQAMALNNIGWLYGQLGDHEAALLHCQRAVDLNREVGDRHAEAGAWDSLGCVHHELGRYDLAADCFDRALALVRGFGDRYNEVDILGHLGRTRQAAGDPGAAIDTWQRALALGQKTDHPAVPQLQAWLKEL